ncbi:hypothetical protein ACFYP4_26885 [Streptomyces sp. NPDC005551]|uniref:hypothetical protein n=1 Tax=unclassified Streptomyces TaxID=2593676 RepID=UPI003403F1BB
MGIESDQLVFDYLSRVGDLAQQRQLPSATRMRLVSELRGEIDRRRAKAPVDTPASVRRILTRLGTPDEVVATAADGATGSGTAADEPDTRAAVPAQRTRPQRTHDKREHPADDRPRGLRRVVPRPRPAAEPEPEPAEAPRDAPSPPHLAGTHELGDSATQPDWWRVDGTTFGPGESVPGFVGGVEIPEILKPPPGKPEPTDEDPPPALPGRTRTPAATEQDVEAAPARRRRLPRLAGRRNPLLLLAAALLVAGAALGNWIALGLGWLIAYTSRRLTPAEAKWAVLVLPGLAATAGIGWLWGRTEGRWGDPVADGHLGDAMAGTWPWVVRGAAVTSALYLAWRSQRPR